MIDYEIISGVLVGAFSFGGAFLKWLDVKKKSVDVHENIVALLQKTLDTNEEIKTLLFLSNKIKIRDNKHEILEVKKLAWANQRTMLVNEMKTIIEANGIHNEKATIEKIKSSIATVIEITDNILCSFNLSKFLAPTKAKIDFINNSNFPEILYKVILDNKTDFFKLDLNVRSVAKQMLQSVKAEFYDDDGVLKSEED